ncbi:tyrosine-type recombinase/integrase [Gilliamella sp. G0441]|uniref:tyrosine-type recombinase/integrase n=1 Tax=Gilliamella sp. G0441 TaxID=3384760 RepID=UPI003D32D64D
MVTRTPKNYAFLMEDDIREFMKALQTYSGNILVRYAIELLILTAVRTVELLRCKWVYVNFEKRYILLPEELIKKDRTHVIPLSKQAINILRFYTGLRGIVILFFLGEMITSRLCPMGHFRVDKMLRFCKTRYWARF